MKYPSTPPLLIVALALAMTACSRGDNASSAATTAPTPTAAPAPEADATLDLSAELAAYRSWVEAQIDGLLNETEKFVAALRAGQIDEAKRLYAPTRMYWERIEPVAELFGDLDPRIDLREADLKPGEPWTGFHAIEKVLWTRNTTKGTDVLGDQLIKDIQALRAKAAAADVTAELMIQGAVDLLNEISTSKITGEEEVFSHTDLYDIKANIEGAEKIFDILKPKLQTRDPELVVTLTSRFKAVHELLDQHRQGDGYRAYTLLTPGDTKALAEAVNKLGEPLARMGILLK
jgi:iron uptake system component EfeO